MASTSQGKAPSSFSDGLGAIIVDIAQAKLTPDADMKFLNQIEMVVMGRLKHDAQGQQGPGGAQPPGAPGAAGGPPPGGPGGPPAAGPPPGPPGPPPGAQSSPGFPTPDPEDMRRTIAQTTGS